MMSKCFASLGITDIASTGSFATKVFMVESTPVERNLTCAAVGRGYAAPLSVALADKRQ